MSFYHGGKLNVNKSSVWLTTDIEQAMVEAKVRHNTDCVWQLKEDFKNSVIQEGQPGHYVIKLNSHLRKSRKFQGKTKEMFVLIKGCEDTNIELNS